MAVVREGITPGGVRYRIMDDAYAGATREELERRRRAACAVAHRILMDCARQESKNTGEAEHETRELCTAGASKDRP